MDVPAPCGSMQHRQEDHHMVPRCFANTSGQGDPKVFWTCSKVCGVGNPAVLAI